MPILGKKITNIFELFADAYFLYFRPFKALVLRIQVPHWLIIR